MRSFQRYDEDIYLWKKSRADIFILGKEKKFIDGCLGVNGTQPPEVEVTTQAHSGEISVGLYLFHCSSSSYFPPKPYLDYFN